MKKLLYTAAMAVAILAASCSQDKSDASGSSEAERAAAVADSIARVKEAEAQAEKAKADSILQAEKAAQAAEELKAKSAEIDAALDELEGLGDSLDAVAAKAAAGDEAAAVKVGPLREGYQTALQTAQALAPDMTPAQLARFNALKAMR